MHKFEKEQVLLIYQYLNQATGGGFGVRDEKLLDSALQSAFQTFNGQELYPTKQEKAARLGHSLICNHAFLDGNKRIGMHIMLSFLEINGIRLTASIDEMFRVAHDVATGEMKYDELHKWILENQWRQT